MWRKRLLAEAHLSVRPRLILSKSQFKVAIVKVGEGQRKSIKDCMPTYFFVLFCFVASIFQPLMIIHLKTFGMSHFINHSDLSARPDQILQESDDSGKPHSEPLLSIASST